MGEIKVWTDEKNALNQRKREVFQQVRARDQWSDEIMADAGTVVTLNYGGDLTVIEGRYKAGSKPPAKKKAKAKAKAKIPYSIPKGAQERLRGLRGDIVRAHMTPDAAHRLMTFQLARSCFTPSASLAPHISEKALDIGFDSDGRERRDSEGMVDKLTERVDRLNIDWMEADDPWAAFNALTDAERQELFTMAVAQTMKPQLTFDDEARPEVEALADELGIEWHHTRPTADLLFQRIPKGQLLAIARERLGVEWAKENAKLRKPELADAMEKAFAQPTTTEAQTFAIPGFTTQD